MSGLSGCVRAGTLWSPALRTSSLAAISHSMLFGPAASREGFAEGGGAGRLEVSDPPVPRETRAGCVTARRPPCQRAELEADSAPGGSPCVASDGQVRGAAGLQGICRLAAATELGRVAGSSPGAVLPGVAAGPLASAPSRLSCFPRFSVGTRLSRIAPISPRALPSRGTLRLLLRVEVSLFRGPSPVPASLRVAFICPQTFFPLHSYLFGCQEPPSASLLFLPLGQDLPFLFSMHVCKTEI